MYGVPVHGGEDDDLYGSYKCTCACAHNSIRMGLETDEVSTENHNVKRKYEAQSGTFVRLWPVRVQCEKKTTTEHSLGSVRYSRTIYCICVYPRIHT